MGCHTWFSVPYKTDKNEIIKLAQEWLDKADHISPGHKQMYQWAIDNEIEEPVCELASYETDCNREYEWTLYKDVTAYSIEMYNLKNGTSIDRVNSKSCHEAEIEEYSNEPRIGGYPERVIHSYDEMVDFMKTGFIDSEGKQRDFYYDEDRKESFMGGIKTFFERHPKGIITFG